MGVEFGGKHSELVSEQPKIVEAQRETISPSRTSPGLSDGLLDLGSESFVEGQGIREEALFRNNSPVPPTTQVDNSDIPPTEGNSKPLSHILLDSD